MKIKIILILTFLTISLSATTLTKNIVNEYIIKENKIVNLIEKYILNEGKIPTKSDLINKYHINLNLFNSLYNQFNVINFNIINNKIVLTNIISNKNITDPNINILKYYKQLSFNGILSSDYNKKYILLDSNSINLIKLKNNLLSNEIISTNKPTDLTKKYWYKPLSNGYFALYKLNSNNNYIKTNFKETNFFIQKANFNINEKCQNNSFILVSDTINNSIERYTCYNGAWLNSSKINNNDNQNNSSVGDNNLYNITCKDDYNIDSNATNVSVYPFNNKKTFIKKAGSTNYNDYWISEDQKDIIIKNNYNLLYYKDIYPNLENGYFCYNNKVVQNKKIKVNSIFKWVTLIDNYKDLFKLTLNSPLNIGNNLFLSWDYFNEIRKENYKQIFKLLPEDQNSTNENNIFYSKYQFNGDQNNIINQKIQIGLNKSKFTIFNNLGKYYTIEKKCNNQCNGTKLNNSNVYNGDYIDQMYLWLWDSNNNQFVDAKRIDNINQLYNDNNGFAVYIDNSNYHTIFYKKKDINGNYCYVNQNNQWITKHLQIIPNSYISNNKANMPTNKTCNTILFNENNQIVLNNREDIVNWDEAEIGMKVSFNNDIYTKNGNKYWESNKEILTNGSREDLPNLTNNNKKKLTLILGTDIDIYDNSKTYRYSDNGFKYNLDNNFYIWVYITNSSKSLNNLIDTDCNNNYRTNICDIKYNNIQFDFKNGLCVLPLNDNFCPIINGIQFKYDSINKNCIKKIKDTDCNNGYTYNKNYNFCIKKICPDDLTFNTNNNRCEKVYTCSENGSYDFTLHQCVKEIAPQRFIYENVNCNYYLKDENVCYLNVNPPNIHNTTDYGYISISNVNLFPNTNLNSENDTMVTNLVQLDNNLLTNNNPNYLNINNFNLISLNYDLINNQMYYTPDNSLCQNAVVNNIYMPLYRFDDGFCYSNIGEQCKYSY